MENKVKMKQVCSKKHMTIKCSDKEKCHCPKLGKKKKKKFVRSTELNLKDTRES